MGRFLLEITPDGVPVVTALEGTGGPEPLPPIAVYTPGNTVTLGRTGNRVAAAVLGEGLLTYYMRVAASINGEVGKAGSILQSPDYYNVGKTGDAILDIAVQVDAFANPQAYGLGGAGGAINPGSGGSTVVEQPTFTNDKAVSSLLPGESRAFKIGEGQSIAFEVTLKEGLFRFGMGEYQTSPSQYEASLSRAAHTYDGAPLRGAGTGPAGNCTIGAFEPFTPGNWYLNVRLKAVGRQGDTFEQFRISFYN